LTGLRYYAFICSIAGIVGLLGLTGFPDTDDQFFENAMEFIFMYGTLNFQICADICLRILGNVLPLSVFIYDGILVFIVISCISMKALTMIVEIEEAISMASLIEYASYILLFVKFPVLGWELQALKSEKNKQD
jgi:hypothetical protein